MEYVDAYGTLPDDFLDEIAQRINASEAAANGEVPQTLTGPALSIAGRTICETEDLKFVALKQAEEFGNDDAHVDGLVQDWEPERIEQLSKVIEGVANEIGINRRIDEMRSGDFSMVNFLSAFGGMSHCSQDYSSVALRNSSVVGLLAAEEIPQDEAESVLFSD